MPASYRIDKPRRVVLSVGSGRLTASDILAHQQKLVQDPDFDPAFSQFWDFTTVVENDITADDVRTIAAITIFSPLSRRAALVTSDEQARLVHMFGTLREKEGEFGVRVFRDRKEALRWAIPAEGDVPSDTDQPASAR
ncbi:MAG: hypothetical protein WBF06_08395 [Candidatus Acidiferrales bacterium]